MLELEDAAGIEGTGTVRVGRTAVDRQRAKTGEAPLTKMAVLYVKVRVGHGSCRSDSAEEHQIFKLI